MSMQKTDDNNKSYRINILFFRRVWKLYRMYWLRKTAWKSWVLLGLLGVVMAGYTYSGASFSVMTREATDALVAKHQDEYIKFIILLSVYGFFRSLLTSLMPLIEGLINIRWWPWLAKDTIGKLLYKNNYYNIQYDSPIDNIDQRIEEEISPVCSALVENPRAVIGSVGDTIVQASILYTLSPQLITLVLGYTLFRFFVTYFIYRPAIRQIFNIKIAEGDFRYSLMQTRNNAEQIALLRGEKAETSSIHGFLGQAINKTMINVRYQWVIGMTSSIIMLLWDVLPMLILVPWYFKGHMSYGEVMQGVASASMMMMSFSILTLQIPQIINVAPSITRLAEVQESNERNMSGEKHPENCITRAVGNSLKITGLTIYIPGTKNLLLNDFNFELSPDKSGRQNIVIMGKTGSGKSSLFRVLSGLWFEGKGEVELPPEKDIFFLPQRPYLISGSLRDQFCYPFPVSAYNDEQLLAVIQLVKLSEMVNQYGSLDSVENWKNCLSLGEQQRIALARVILAKPGYVFLDEATSALDPDTEANIYYQLFNMNINIITIAHNDTVIKYHHYLLQLHSDGEWTIENLLLPSNEIEPGLKK